MEKKEIDIIDLIVLINKFLKRRRNLLIISLITGIIIGVMSYFFTKNSYRTNLFVNSSIINKNLLYQSFSPLKINLKNNNIDFLQKKLNISKKDVKQLADFLVDTATGNNSLRINIELYDKNSLNTISNGFVYYINNLNFVKGNISVERENLKKYILEVDSQLVNIKKIQKLLLNDLNNKNIQINNIGGINEAYVNIYAKRIDLQKRFNETNQVFLYNDISEDFIPQNSLLKKVVFDAIIFIIIGFFMALYLEIRAIVKNK